MTDTTTRESSFIRSLADLARKDDRAALAALRRGLGRPPGAAPEMYPYVARYFPKDNSSRELEDAMFTVAALFGLLPNHRAGAGSPCTVLRLLNIESESIERRVLGLLDADTESLPDHLRHIITLIRSHDADRQIDYGLLLHNLRQWDHPERWVQRQWARDWWAWSVPVTPGDQDQSTIGNDEEEVSS